MVRKFSASCRGADVTGEWRRRVISNAITDGRGRELAAAQLCQKFFAKSPPGASTSAPMRTTRASPASSYSRLGRFARSRFAGVGVLPAVGIETNQRTPAAAVGGGYVPASSAGCGLARIRDYRLSPGCFEVPHLQAKNGELRRTSNMLVRKPSGVSRCRAA